MKIYEIVRYLFQYQFCFFNEWFVSFVNELRIKCSFSSLTESSDDFQKLPFVNGTLTSSSFEWFILHSPDRKFSVTKFNYYFCEISSNIYNNIDNIYNTIDNIHDNIQDNIHDNIHGNIHDNTHNNTHDDIIQEDSLKTCQSPPFPR